MNESSSLMKIREAAQYLAVSRGTLYKLMDNGELPYLKIGKARRVEHRALQELIDRNRRGVSFARTG
jgi:excisionase family DNA binding protein